MQLLIWRLNKKILRKCHFKLKLQIIIIIIIIIIIQNAAHQWWSMTVLCPWWLPFFSCSSNLHASFTPSLSSWYHYFAWLLFASITNEKLDLREELKGLMWLLGLPKATPNHLNDLRWLGPPKAHPKSFQFFLTHHATFPMKFWHILRLFWGYFLGHL